MMKTVTVSAPALREVLRAVLGPSHLIRELQVTLSLPDNPIITLINEYSAAAETHQEASDNEHT